MKNGVVRIGVDFGPGTTVVAIAVPGRECSTLALPGISFEAGNPPVQCIPSLIQYQDGEAIRFGDEVARAGETENPATARWIRRSVIERSPVQLPAGNSRKVRYDDACRDFLSRILITALEQHPGAELVFSLPEGAPLEYSELLHRIAREAKAASVSFTGEAEAACAGCNFSPERDDPFLHLGFDASGIRAEVLIPAGDPAIYSGSMRGLGRASDTTGCRAIDSWIVSDILVKFRLLESDDRAMRLRPGLMYNAGRLRSLLAHKPCETITITDEVTGRVFSTTYTAADLDRVLVDRNVISAVTGCIDRALSAMRQKGAEPGLVRTVLLTGDGCAIPAVQDAVQSHLPLCTVLSSHPVLAIARGAALLKAPEKAPDRIRRSYALRYWDATAKEHRYRYIVHAGTRYPSMGQVARVIISAAYDGQAHLGIPLYEIGDQRAGDGLSIELVSESGGGARIAGPEKETGGGGSVVHANERSPTLLTANPPARQGEPRFECTFTIDAERNLCVSARDLMTGTLVKVNAPVHRLA